MNYKRLLGTKELEDSPVVANCCMNRERDLHGSNGYDDELGFDPLEWLRNRLNKQTIVRWLDLCCGSGRALIQAATMSDEVGSRSIQITGVDLVGMFLPNNSSDMKLVQCSFLTTSRRNDLTWSPAFMDSTILAISCERLNLQCLGW